MDPGSAKASFAGSYDGSLGTGKATFVADTTGVHVRDTFRIKMYAPNGTFLQNIDINSNDPPSKAYAVSGGLTLTLGAGNWIQGRIVGLNLSATATFQTDPLPVESTATVTMGGVYNGSQGTGPLKFKVAQGGIHGTNNLSLQVYAPDNSLIDTLAVASTDPLNQSYTLSNGLSFQISDGSLKTGESFMVNVDHQTPMPSTRTTRLTIREWPTEFLTLDSPSRRALSQ